MKEKDKNLSTSKSKLNLLKLDSQKHQVESKVPQVIETMNLMDLNLKVKNL